MPRFVMVGLSHHAAPLEVRERVAVDEPGWRAHAPASFSTVLLSTCNRVEVYAWVEARPSVAVRSLQRCLAHAAGIELGALRPHLHTASGRDALVHLVRVVSGLDSLIVGEEQIRGQVRTALHAAEAIGPLPAALRGVFERVGESARRIRGGTRLSTAPSIASAGVSVASRALPASLDGQVAVVLGAGVTARAAAEALLAGGARILVLNRTPAHAERLRSQLGSAVEVESLDALPRALAEAALVVGATASRQPVVKRDMLERAVSLRPDRLPLVVLDIALPRDIDPRARDLPGVTLLDLDDLEHLCPVDAQTRHAEHARAEALALIEADRLVEWLRFRAVSPAIAELRTYAETIRQGELRRSAPRLRDLTPEQVAAVDALTTGIVNKLMHGPTVALREAATSPSALGRSRSRILRVVRATRGRTA
ncbi:MAG: glutamyl-tRNA reductase [Chloroflexi bacterium]|nr:glutamyl-tRNA reductase [Chloroflexota bacterium]